MVATSRLLRTLLSREVSESPGRDALDAERDRLVELGIPVLLVLLLKQADRAVELRPAPNYPRSSSRNDSTQPAPVFEVVVAFERRGRATAQVPSGPTARGDVRGSPRGIERVAERRDVRCPASVVRSHAADASAIEEALLLWRETGVHVESPCCRLRSVDRAAMPCISQTSRPSARERVRASRR